MVPEGRYTFGVPHTTEVIDLTSPGGRAKASNPKFSVSLGPGFSVAASACTSGAPPPILLQHIPEATTSIAITMYDTTAQFTHWVVWNYGKPGQVTGVNSYKKYEYAAPCPPTSDARQHEYVFTAYALAGAPPKALQHETKFQNVEAALQSLAIATAQTSVQFSRHA